ncbi:MAG: hypothetical protein OHK0022_10080 [Roseiflexaceae bacterium]
MDGMYDVRVAFGGLMFIFCALSKAVEINMRERSLNASFAERFQGITLLIMGIFFVFFYMGTSWGFDVTGVVSAVFISNVALSFFYLFKTRKK